MGQLENLCSTETRKKKSHGTFYAMAHTIFYPLLTFTIINISGLVISIQPELIDLDAFRGPVFC